MSHLIVSLILVILFISACQTSPTGRRQWAVVPSEQMEQMGEQGFEEMKQKLPQSKNVAVNSYVKCVARAITDIVPDKQSWEIVVFQDDSANAFALPGGNIGVHTGLLKVAENEDQLAAVLGHEVGHVLAEHSRARVSEQLVTQGGLSLLSAVLEKKSGENYQLLMAALGLGTQFGLILPHSRAQESEADVIGLDLMAKAGFNPEQSTQLWRNMAASGGGKGQPEFLSTHPSPQSRIDNLQSHMAESINTYKSSDKKPDCRKP